ncbi:hypothetical protein BD749_0672 [Pontibacter ramchanderi]|uniref:Uncharacterized protein n=1 Tax=Pontibacter ramchanderi TaxID=1179743 RepID=A0A2N3V2D7_9BACT|nr:hypothetical protein BD749_0672 [Pontibacter ramchanderi]
MNVHINSNGIQEEAIEFMLLLRQNLIAQAARLPCSD